MSQKVSYFPIEGGEDHVTSAITVPPGRLRFSRNFECDLNGKYRRIDGYERFDGRPKPSEASYWVLDFKGGKTEIVADDTIEGATSGATATVLHTIVESGSWDGDDAQGYLIITNPTGNFQADEDIEVSSAVVAVVDQAEEERGDEDNDTDYYREAIEYARDAIEAVPGSGEIRGVWHYGDHGYAFRDNTLGTAGVMYQSSTSGWQVCDLGRTLWFNTGDIEIAEDSQIIGKTSEAIATVRRIIVTDGAWTGGDAEGRLVVYDQVGDFEKEEIAVYYEDRIDFTGGSTEIIATDIIVGGTSGAVADVDDVVVSSGDWGTSDAVGYLVISGKVGNFQGNEDIDVGATTCATTDIPTVAKVDDNSEANTLPAGGRYYFVNYNFGGYTGTRRMYACNGVGNAFEWDGQTFVPVLTGMAEDTPFLITAHKSHLFLAYRGGSLQHSSLVLPYSWSVILGAAELGMGSEITGLISLPNALGIVTTNSTHILYGSSTLDWSLRTLSMDSGGLLHSAQSLGGGLFVGQRGITSLLATDAYGDFQSVVLSSLIHPILKGKLNQVQASISVKQKSQYRIFFSDGDIITMTADGMKIYGFTRQVYEHTPVCCAAGEDSDGFEVLLFGDADGFVYEMDKGTSFDGESVQAIIRTHFNHFKTPSNKKRFRKLVLELEASLGVMVNVTPDMSYGGEDSLASSDEFWVPAQGGAWDISSWGEFVWDGPFVGLAEARIDGTGTNLALLMSTNTIYEEPYVLQGVIVHYDVRGLKR